jgi:hypothetical protein
MTNIRGREKSPKVILNKEDEALHECFDCKGCICEDVCKSYEKEILKGRKTIKEEGD